MGGVQAPGRGADGHGSAAAPPRLGPAGDGGPVPGGRDRAPRDRTVALTWLPRLIATIQEASLLVFDGFHAIGVRSSRVIVCNSLHVLTALAAAGLGVSFLSERHVRPEIDAGRLRVFRTVPALPSAQHVFAFRVDAPDAFTEHVIRLVQRCCDVG